MVQPAKIGTSEVVDETSYVFVDQLQQGKQASVRVMICRSWDTHTKTGKYLSTDFIASDEKGNVIQITAKNNTAHCFIHRLKEGSVYFLSDFDVVPNKPDYRLLNDNQVMIQLQGSTRLRKQPTNDTRGFIRHPFNCIKFEALTPINDVVGYAVNVGSLVDLKTGDTILEFDLANERPFFRSGEVLPTRPPVHCSIIGNREAQLPRNSDPLQYIIYSGSGRPRNSRTVGIHEQPQLRKGLRGKVATIGANHAPRMFCTQIQENMFAPTEKTDGKVINPHNRFKIHLEVTDGTGEAVVVLFDETAEKLVKATAKSLVAELDEDSPSHVLPNPIANLVNTSQTLLLKAGTHYEHGSHESFNCLRVLNSAPIDIETAATAKKDQTPAIEPPVSTPNGKKWNLAVTTPAKESDRPNRRK
ncbi:uncharacterized protein [Rutidosis leptorrhynchoides]|uniref:uncharacterized protein n=1 Tax=Rutidosis leptorrhynchoides TaxID=125765 RepID=UPI003A99063A